jgi:sugar-specific transcriptional regulator TrmB
MEINENLLKTLGLSEMQAKVYIAALELSEATMQALARKSGVNRSTIYTFIDDLKDRGFILEGRRRKRNVYSAVHPEALVDMQKSRLGELERVLPELLAINNKSGNKPRVTFYEGFSGIEDVYKDQLREKKEIVSYEDLEDLKGELPKHIFEWFPAERAKRDILIRTISRDVPFAREFSKRNRGLLRETKFVTAQKFRTDINIYGDKVALIDLQAESPFAVIIENHNLAETMRTVWRELWEKLGPVVG